MDRTMAGRHTPSLEYKPEPLHRTRSELLAARKEGMKDSITYDLDGDGFVSGRGGVGGAVGVDAENCEVIVAATVMRFCLSQFGGSAKVALRYMTATLLVDAVPGWRVSCVSAGGPY